MDAFCRTSLPHVYAIGHCALRCNAFASGASIHLESVQNANDTASTAARAVAGEPVPYQAVPWLWSNQYDLRLQTVALSTSHDRELLRGNPADAASQLSTSGTAGWSRSPARTPPRIICRTRRWW